MTKVNPDLESELSKLEGRRADLANELEAVQVKISAKAAAMGEALLDGREVTKDLEELGELQSRRDVLTEAIHQADSRLGDLRQALKIAQRDAALAQARRLDADAHEPLAALLAAEMTARKSITALLELIANANRAVDGAYDPKHGKPDLLIFSPGVGGFIGVFNAPHADTVIQRFCERYPDLEAKAKALID